jgi:hypothetical protein
MDQIKSQSWYQLCAAAVIELDPKLLIGRVDADADRSPDSKTKVQLGNEQ